MGTFIKKLSLALFTMRSCHQSSTTNCWHLRKWQSIKYKNSSNRLQISIRTIVHNIFLFAGGALCGIRIICNFNCILYLLNNMVYFYCHAMNATKKIFTWMFIIARATCMIMCVGFYHTKQDFISQSLILIPIFDQGFVAGIHLSDWKYWRYADWYWNWDFLDDIEWTNAFFCGLWYLTISWGR